MAFNYQRYLASREWASLREAVRARADGWCEHCLIARIQATHHLTYERIGHEDLADLQGVCGPCHEYLSAKTDFDPAKEAHIEFFCALIELLRERTAEDAKIQAAMHEAMQACMDRYPQGARTPDAHVEGYLAGRTEPLPQAYLRMKATYVLAAREAA